jgi:hypothetical protein
MPTTPVTGTFWQATQPVSIAATVNVAGPLTDTQLRATPVPISGSGTFAVTQSGTWNIGTVTTLTSITNPVAVTGTFFQSIQPISIDQTGNNNAVDVLTLPAIPAGTNNIGDVDIASIAAGDNNIGNVDVLTLPNVTIGTFPDNEPFNVAQIGGSAVVTAATGVQRIGIAGNANAAIDAANNAAAPANVLVGGFEAATQTSTQPTAATAGNVRRGVISTDGSFYTRPHGPVIWSCGLNAIGTTLTQCQAAPGAGLRLYITDVVSQSNTATAGLFTIRFGTGTNCGTGTGNLFYNSASALMASPANTVAVNHFHLTVPIAVTANNAICVLGVATNTTNIQINGYTAP